MAVPKSKVSKQRKRKRRTHYAFCAQRFHADSVMHSSFPRSMQDADIAMARKLLGRGLSKQSRAFGSYST